MKIAAITSIISATEVEHDCNDFFRTNSTKPAGCLGIKRFSLALTAIQAHAPALDGRDVLSVLRRQAPVKQKRHICLPALQHLLDFPRKIGAAAYSDPDANPNEDWRNAGCRHARELAKSMRHLDIATITGGVAYMNFMLKCSGSV